MGSQRRYIAWNKSLKFTGLVHFSVTKEQSGKPDFLLMQAWPRQHLPTSQRSHPALYIRDPQTNVGSTARSGTLILANASTPSSTATSYEPLRSLHNPIPSSLQPAATKRSCESSTSPAPTPAGIVVPHPPQLVPTA